MLVAQSMRLGSPAYAAGPWGQASCAYPTVAIPLSHSPSACPHPPARRSALREVRRSPAAPPPAASTGRPPFGAFRAGRAPFLPPPPAGRTPFSPQRPPPLRQPGFPAFPSAAFPCTEGLRAGLPGFLTARIPPVPFFLRSPSPSPTPFPAPLPARPTIEGLPPFPPAMPLSEFPSLTCFVFAFGFDFAFAFGVVFAFGLDAAFGSAFFLSIVFHIFFIVRICVHEHPVRLGPEHFGLHQQFGLEERKIVQQPIVVGQAPPYQFGRPFGRGPPVHLVPAGDWIVLERGRVARIVQHEQATPQACLPRHELPPDERAEIDVALARVVQVAHFPFVPEPPVRQGSDLHELQIGGGGGEDVLDVFRGLRLVCVVQHEVLPFHPGRKFVERAVGPMLEKHPVLVAVVSKIPVCKFAFAHMKDSSLGFLQHLEYLPLVVPGTVHIFVRYARNVRTQPPDDNLGAARVADHPKDVRLERQQHLGQDYDSVGGGQVDFGLPVAHIVVVQRRIVFVLGEHSACVKNLAAGAPPFQVRREHVQDLYPASPLVPYIVYVNPGFLAYPYHLSEIIFSNRMRT